MNVFLERGEQLARSRELMKGDREFISALALVSIHSAIAFNDALLVKLTGSYSVSQDHMSAVRHAKKQCSSRKIPTHGFQQLEKLVAKKATVSYSDERTTFELAFALSEASRRFEAWVRPLLK